MLNKLLSGNYDKQLKWLTLISALVTFAWSVHTWNADRQKERNKPFFDKQLELYVLATRTAAQVATNFTTIDSAKQTADYKLFWRLYYCELSLVEDDVVEKAMVAIGDELRQPAPDKDCLEEGALDLAHACRTSLDASWDIHAWTDPDKANKSWL